MSPTKPEDRFMRRAIALSRRGFPAPNPHVGCVIVANNEIVAEGYHDHAGGPHAEAMALASAGSLARGADAYVTLEPCNHFGRTPPCSQALIQAGIRRVFVAIQDRNPRAAGGVQVLREAGIEVVTDVLSATAAAANRLFIHSLGLARPYVIAKAAIGMDSRIALPTGESKWITGPKARAEGHRLRAECGAVLVGRRTVELDDPALTARLPGVSNQPLRIVLDPGGKLSRAHRVFSAEAETWHVTGNIDLHELMRKLHAVGHIGLLVEGGGVTIAHFLEADLIDEIKLFVAPKIFGDGPNWVHGFAVKSLADAPEFRYGKPRMLGTDTELSAFRMRQ